jgi:hypothetical protein
MAYFSSKSTWLSLVDGGLAHANPSTLRLDGSHTAGPDGFALPSPDFTPVSARDDAAPAAGPVDTQEDLDYLRITIELRHRLFFHFKEWEFGPALLEDHIRLARAQSDPEAALEHYCLARHVAATLVGKLELEDYRVAWIETDRVIAEIHALIGNDESCAVYAREGLKAIKQGRFSANHDMRITKLAIRFISLLERK